MLQGFLADGVNDLARAALTMEHLAREGQFTQPEEQAAAVPRQVLDEIKNFARKALVRVPDGSTPTLEYTNIGQEPGEAYIRFIDWLTQALEKQVIDDKTRSKLLETLAVANTNPECQKVLYALPWEPPPTLLQVIEACNRLGMVEHMEAVQGQAFEQGLAKALLAAQFKSPQLQCQPTCFRCVNKDTFEKIVHKERANTQFLARINTRLNSFLPKEITVLAISPDPPCFIPKALPIAQAIMLLDETEEDSESFVIWTQIISKDRSKITCTLEDNGQKVLVLHYKDVILLAAKDATTLDTAVKDTISAVEKAGSTVSEEKVQQMQPRKYLGYKISSQTIKPQLLRLEENSRTVHDMQRSGKSHKSVITWQNPVTGEWLSDTEIVEGSPQIVELAAAVRALAGIMERAENSVLKDIANEQLYSLLKNLIFLLSHPYFIMHICSHTTLPGPLTQDKGPRWMPAKNIKPYLQPLKEDPPGNSSIPTPNSEPATTTPRN
ncbi:hypothetical protein TURU_092595 [Turdus rufiventris]|nr:hypothetical protein TURU_092595 [Turdus rufiventris]